MFPSLMAEIVWYSFSIILYGRDSTLYVIGDFVGNLE